jgi:hypothetical protein
MSSPVAVGAMAPTLPAFVSVACVLRSASTGTFTV